VNFYNEHDAHAAAWLRELIARKLIPDGVVDERSITEIRASDLSSFVQCHFFAGIAGWSLALQLAGWPEDRPVWTGSCPCQPFSVAGKGLGEKDERHLWPVFRDLIDAGQPPVVFGEQVASKDGRTWLAGVFADLERMGYQRAGADLCAAGIGSPHIRQRLYWLADAQLARREATGLRPEIDAGRQPEQGRTPCRLADSIGEGLEGHRGDERDRSESGRFDALAAGPVAAGGAVGWSDAKWHLCRDGKHRRVPTKPALFPLADGLPYKLARRGTVRPAILKGAGNAIVPQVAAEFIQAYLEVTAP
jgi:DNA (cytosine-5)-methyltransferase 1